MNLYLLYGLISGEKERDTDYKTVAVGEEWEEKNILQNIKWNYYRYKNN